MQKYLVLTIISIFFLNIPNILSQPSKPTDIFPPDSLTSDSKRIYFTSRFKSEGPKIDGQLNDKCWEGVGKLNLTH